MISERAETHYSRARGALGSELYGVSTFAGKLVEQSDDPSLARSAAGENLDVSIRFSVAGEKLDNLPFYLSAAGEFLTISHLRRRRRKFGFSFPSDSAPQAKFLTISRHLRRRRRKFG